MMFPSGSIAVVGNGPCQIGKKTGEEIDAHEYVYRFNNFKIEGYEEDYGSKTTHWCWNGYDDVTIQYNYPVYITTPILDDRFLYNVPDDHIPAFNKYVDLIKHKCYIQIIPYTLYDMRLSAGANMVLWLRSVGAEFDLYGFSNFNPELKHHYFEDMNNKYRYDHNFLLEHEIIWG